MELEFLKEILMWIIPAGAFGSVVTFFATRKTRRMDVLQKLQDSIDLLTTKYTEVLDENVQLKADNAKLLANQKALEEKIDAMNSKIDFLTKQLKAQKNGNSHQAKASSASSSRSVTHNGMRTGKQGGKVPADGDDPGGRQSTACCTRSAA